MDEINIEDFMKVDLRIAKVKEAIEVPEADKLVKLILDVGELGDPFLILEVSMLKFGLPFEKVKIYCWAIKDVVRA